MQYTQRIAVEEELVISRTAAAVGLENHELDGIQGCRGDNWIIDGRAVVAAVAHAVTVRIHLGRI